MKFLHTLVTASGAVALATAAQANPAATETTAPAVEAEAETAVEAQADATAEEPADTAAADAAATVTLDTVLVTGAEVVTADNQPLGTISKVDGENVVMTLVAFEERPVSFKRDHFTVNEEGKLASVFTAEQITAGLG